MVRFHFLTGDVNWQKYGGKFVSNRLNNGDFNYWLVLDVINMPEETGDDNQPTYNVSLLAVSPESAGIETVNKALESAGLPDGLEVTPEIAVEVLCDYGTYAQLKTFNGNNIRALLAQAKHEAQLADSLFGFYMDAPENRIGSSGWDMIAGNVLAGLNR